MPRDPGWIPPGAPQQRPKTPQAKLDWVPAGANVAAQRNSTIPGWLRALSPGSHHAAALAAALLYIVALSSWRSTAPETALRQVPTTPAPLFAIVIGRPADLDSICAAQIGDAGLCEITRRCAAATSAPAQPSELRLYLRQPNPGSCEPF